MILVGSQDHLSHVFKMIRHWFSGEKPQAGIVSEIIQLRGLVVHHHLVIDGDDVHLIDGGFLGGVSRIRKTLGKRGMTLANVRSLILTHGHLDHTLNVAKIKNLTRCKVFAPRLDRAHLEGRYPYQGWDKFCGWPEAVGRLLLQYSPPTIDEWFDDGDDILGFQVIALPGHTIGHCGFYQQATERLIAGDLFTNHLGTPKTPPRFLNDNHRQALHSIQKAAALQPREVYLNHSKKSPPSSHADCLQKLARSLLSTDQGINNPPKQG